MRHLSRLVAAALVVAVTSLVLPASPAAAAACPSDSGVTVVVDFNQLGGGVQQLCDADGGGDTAASLFSAGGYALTYAQRQPGFVCRVNGVPASDPCVNTSPSDAYWGLYWSDGESGQWAYSSLGAASLNIPDGGYVAFSWKQGSAPAPPSASAAPHTPPPPPPIEPTQGPPSPGGDGNGGGHHGNNGDGGNGGDDEPTSSATPSGSASPSESAEPGDGDKWKPGKKRHRDPSASPSASATEDPSVSPSDDAETDVETDVAPTASPAEADDDGLPGWVAPVLIVVLFAAATATVILRRRGAARP
jgi:hypothetical protein